MPQANRTRHLTVMKTCFIILLIFIQSAPSSSQTSKEEIRSVISEFLKCWETNDIETFDRLLHDSVLFAYPGDRLNKSELLDMFKVYQMEKKDIKIYLWETLLSDSNRFASAYQFAATDRVTGKRQAVGTGIVGEVKDARIILFKEYYDESVSTLQYQGKLPLDEGIVTPWPASVWLRPETID